MRHVTKRSVLDGMAARWQGNGQPLDHQEVHHLDELKALGEHPEEEDVFNIISGNKITIKCTECEEEVDGIVMINEEHPDGEDLCKDCLTNALELFGE